MATTLTEEKVSSLWMGEKTSSGSTENAIPVAEYTRLRIERNGKRLLSHAVDIQAVQNRHDFLVATDCCIYPKLEDDWKLFGAKAFVFEELEVIEMKQGQSPDDFEADLIELEQLWRERLGASDEY